MAKAPFVCCLGKTLDSSSLLFTKYKSGLWPRWGIFGYHFSKISRLSSIQLKKWLVWQSMVANMGYVWSLYYYIVLLIIHVLSNYGPMIWVWVRSVYMWLIWAMFGLCTMSLVYIWYFGLFFFFIFDFVRPGLRINGMVNLECETWNSKVGIAVLL